MNKNYGFIEPVIEADHWVLGGVGDFKGVKLTDGHWLKYSPDKESQSRNGIETNGCSIYGTLNALETLFFFLFGVKKNWSERFIAVLANNSPYGNDPHKVIEVIRENGLINDLLLPFDDSVKTWDQWRSPVPMRNDLLAEGLKFLKEYTINHDWVPTTTDNLKEALKYSPLGVAVVAWQKNAEGLYYSPPKSLPNHWVELIDYEEGKYWMVYDSYDEDFKKLSWDSFFYFAKRYYIGKPTPAVSNLFKSIVDMFISFFKLSMSNPPIVPDAVKHPAPVQPTTHVVPVAPVPKYEWDTPEKARHSVRVICDEMGLSVAEKNLLCQVLRCESGFKIGEKNLNKDGTTDYGICQYNSYWYIGKGKPIASIDEALNNPEKCVRVMIKTYKSGRLKDWVCFSSGMYKTCKP